MHTLFLYSLLTLWKSLSGERASLAYIHFKTPEAVLKFHADFNGHAFVDTNGTLPHFIVLTLPYLPLSFLILFQSLLLHLPPMFHLSFTALLFHSSFAFHCVLVFRRGCSALHHLSLCLMLHPQLRPRVRVCCGVCALSEGAARHARRLQESFVLPFSHSVYSLVLK